MSNRHIVKSYDRDLGLLKSKLSEMGKETQDQISKAKQAFLDHDHVLADVVIVSDEKVNVLNHEVESLCLRILATRQPLSKDLRYVVSGLKMASELERIADYAGNISMHIRDLNHFPDNDQAVEAIAEMMALVKEMLIEIMEAFSEEDVQKAIAVWHRDDEIDQIYANLLGDLNARMAENAEHLKSYTSLIFIARCCERMGDHITNLAESVHYIEHGKVYVDGNVFSL
jgi:phosphate transport system protein